MTDRSVRLAQRLRRAVAVGVTGAVLGSTWLSATSAQAAPAPIIPTPTNTVTADALPTVQIDGVVWSQAVVGNTVYAGGRFNNARPAGAAGGHQPDAARQPAGLRHHHRQPDHVVRAAALNGQVLRSPRRRTARGSTWSVTSPPRTAGPLAAGWPPTTPPPVR